MSTAVWPVSAQLAPGAKFPGPVGRVSVQLFLTSPNLSMHRRAKMSSLTGLACPVALRVACPSPSQSVPLPCGMRQYDLCVGLSLRRKGRISPSPISALPLEGEGPADAPSLGRTDGGHLDLTILGGGGTWHRDVFVSSAASPFFKESSCCAGARGEVGWR